MIKVKYLDKSITKLEKNEKGDLIDLRVSTVSVNGVCKILGKCNSGERITYAAGDVVTIGFGVAMELPEGFKGNIYPRSSTFKNYGLILTNSVGQVDNSYKGEGDQWKAMFYALKDGSIEYDERIAQFDITPVYLKEYELIEVETLGNKNRGGYGTTGVK